MMYLFVFVSIGDCLKEPRKKFLQWVDLHFPPDKGVRYPQDRRHLHWIVALAVSGCNLSQRPTKSLGTTLPQLWCRTTPTPPFARGICHGTENVVSKV